MTVDQLRARVAGLLVWKQGGQRAPHKPLLLLYALARFAEGRNGLAFAEVEPALRRLLHAYGPQRRSQHPEYPFWHLQSDGLWTLEDSGLTLRQGHNAPTLASLRAQNPVGRFPDDVAAALHRGPDLVAELAHALLDAHFPDSLHDEILDAVGLETTPLPPELAMPTRRRRRRDPAFREAVLQAYGYRCAMCGFETRVGNALVGVDAAHVMWHQAGGADAVENGLALCVLHHRLLDRGAFTFAHEGASSLVVEVSEAAHGGEGFDRWVLAYHGQPITPPVSAHYRVAEPSLVWHRKEVFRGTIRTR